MRTLPAVAAELLGLVRDIGPGLRKAEVELDQLRDPADAYRSPIYTNALSMIYGAGLHKATLPVEVGGLGGPSEVGFQIREELAYFAPGFASVLLVAPMAAATLSYLGLHNRPGRFRELVDAFVNDTTGTHSSAWGLTEPSIGSDVFTFDRPVSFETQAERRGGAWRISGAKSPYVSNGWLADSLIVMASVDAKAGMHGTGTFLVPGDAVGISRGKPLDKLGLRALNQAQLKFDAVELTDECLLVPPGAAYQPTFEALVTAGNTSVGSIAIGVARAAYDSALKYAQTRQQGGKRLIELELVAIKLFTMFRDIQASKLMLQESARLIGRGTPHLVMAMAARSLACETCARATSDAIQVFGGAGIVREQHLEKLYRDSKLLQIMDGTVDRVSLMAAGQL